MDDDLFQFEAPGETAPELVLGKKKKKKKKKSKEPSIDPDPDADLDAGPSSNPFEHDAQPEDSPSESDVLKAKKKKKKKKLDLPTINGDPDETADDPDDPTPAPSEPTTDDVLPPPLLGKKKKKKNTLNLDPSLDSPLSADPELQPESETPAESSSTSEPRRPLTAAEKKKAKKERERLAKLEKSKRENDDLDAILAELGEGPSSSKPDDAASSAATLTADTPSAAAEDNTPSAPLTAAQKKRLKKKKKAVAEKTDADVDTKPVDDVNALLADLDGNSDPKEKPEESQPDAGASAGGVDDLLAELAGDALPSAKKKPKKKKKPAADAKPADDVDALLEELGGAPSESITKDEEPQHEQEGQDPASAEGVDDLLAELAGDTPSAAKKKAKKKKKKGTAKADGEGAAEGEEAPPVETKKPKKKESAAVRRMREQREKMLAEEERLRKLKEEEEARIKAEEDRRLEEIKKKEEEKAKKKAAEKAKRERKKAEGTLLSKSEKDRRRKAEAFRKQLEASGMIPAVSKGDDTTTEHPTQSGSVYARRKRSKNKASGGPNDGAEKTEPSEKPVEGTSDKGVVETISEGVTEEKVPEPPAPPAEVVLDDWDVEQVEEEKKVDDSATNRDEKTEGKADESDDNDDDDGDSEDDSEDDDDSEYEGMSKAEIAAEKRVEALRRERSKQKEAAMAARTKDHLRSPVICILGHVDTGKTKILDKIRRTNVQDGEAGGITQQIGATYFPIDAVKKEATKLAEGKELSYNVPSLLIIDTPGHESFTNLRSRGSSLCDIAILVVDIMHGLESQTRESIDLLKLRKTPFIVALNKIDRIFDWEAQPHNCPTREALAKQKKHAREEFLRRVEETKVEFSEIGFNTELYWNNEDVRKTVSLVPTSAISGEGIPDLLMLLLALPQKLLTERLMFNPILEATVLEVKVIEGLGTTIDIILTGGTIKEGDTIMAVGLDGPIVATIRALLTPHPMKEMRVKGQYLHHKQIQAAQGIKISADGLEKAVAGTQIMVVQDPSNEDEMEYVRDEVMKDFQTILTNVDKSGLGVYVQASTLGSLEALLEFLRTSEIPVSGINIGPVHKRDVTKASTMLEKRKEFATILAFDVSVEREAKELAEQEDVRIFTADIIYHLFDQFTAYMEEMKKMRREQVNDEVVFPSISKILPQHVYNKKDPIVVGVDVMEGILRVGTPLVVRHSDSWLDVGRVASIELNKKQVITAKKGESVAVKIQHKSTEHIMYGRHFDFTNQLVSKMSRSAIDLLKESFRDDLEKDDWRLVVKLKKMFDII